MKKFALVALCALLGVTTAWASSIGGDPGPWGNSIFVRGGWNGWGVTDEMTWDGADEVFTADLSITAGMWEFKIADEGWVNPDFGPTSDPVVTLGSPTDIGTAIGANFALDLAADGIYRFTLSDISQDLSSGILTVTRIPVPAAFFLFASGLAGLRFLRRRG